MERKIVPGEAKEKKSVSASMGNGRDSTFVASFEFSLGIVLRHEKSIITGAMLYSILKRLRISFSNHKLRVPKISFLLPGS